MATRFPAIRVAAGPSSVRPSRLARRRSSSSACGDCHSQVNPWTSFSSPARAGRVDLNESRRDHEEEAPVRAHQVLEKDGVGVEYLRLDGRRLQRLGRR